MAYTSKYLGVVLTTLFVHISAPSTDISELCPYTKFCTKGPIRHLNESGDAKPCCSPCSCEDDCFLFGTCCPDKENMTSNEEIIFPCRYQEEIYERYLARNISSSVTSNVELRVVDLCGPDAYDDPVQQVAVQRCHQVQKLEDLVFVSDVQTDRIYLNKHCAECNGVKTIVVWNLHIPCINIFRIPFSSFDERDRYIIENCVMFSVSPGKHIGQMSICRKDAIKTCSHVNSWDLIDNELKRMCQMYDMPYTTESNSYFYANIYCYMCNNPRGTSYRAKCEALEDVKITSKTVFYPFTAIVTFQEDRQKAIPEGLQGFTTCASDEIIDRITKKCVKLLCPEGFLAMSGSCVAFVDGDDGYGVLVRLGFKFADVLERPTFKDKVTIIHATKITFLRAFKDRHIACGIGKLCAFGLVSGDASVDFHFHSQPNCNHKELLAAVADIVRQAHIEVVLKKLKLSIPTYLIEHENDIGTEFVLWFEEYYDFEYYTLFTRQTVYCPSIEYNLFDIRNSTIDSALVDVILEQSDQTDAHKFRICIKNLTLSFEWSASTGFTNAIFSSWMPLIVSTVTVFISKYFAEG